MEGLRFFRLYIVFSFYLRDCEDREEDSREELFVSRFGGFYRVFFFLDVVAVVK